MAPVRRPLLLLAVEPDEEGRATITMPGPGQVVKTESKGKGNKGIRIEVVDA